MVTTYTSDGTWFIAGTEATLIDDYRPQMDSGLFRGQRRCEDPTVEGHALGECYEDEEVCRFDEFRIVGMNGIAVWKVITTVAGLREHYPNHKPPADGGPFLVIELDDRTVVFNADALRHMLEGYQKAVSERGKLLEDEVPK